MTANENRPEAIEAVPKVLADYPQVTDLRNRAAQASESASRRLDGIRADTRLSDAGKAEETERIRTALIAQLGALQADEDRIVGDKLRSLERTVLGVVGVDPAEAISYRDATERATAIDNLQVASEAMRRALISYDPPLAKALLNRALEMGWTEVADQYKAENPGVADALTDLQRLKNYVADPNRMVHRWVYTTGQYA